MNLNKEWKIAILLLLITPLVSASNFDPEVVVVFLFTSLMIGATITFLLSRYAPSIPYTVVIFACGAILGVSFAPIASSNTMKQSEDMWNSMDPNLILYLFLPALLFGEAMSLNFHHVRGAVVNAAFLAGPGALIGALLMACVAKVCLPYNWDWTLCIIFGSILCATDPVAVVALLKSAGASHKLTYLIIGEALMNDGTALVLYNLLFSAVEVGNNTEITPLSVFIYFLRVIFVSPLLGAAFGMAAVMCLSATNQRMKEEDTTVQMAVTVCCAYLSFFLAEYVLEVSGVLCCCAAALTLARFANPLILRPETLHSIWAAFEWIGNTIIFILAGLIIGARTFEYMGGIDVLLVFVIYIFAFLIRAFIMLIFMPLMESGRYGKQITREDAIFATWGGLRGAVSMALALSLVHSTETGEANVSNQNSHRVFFLVGGVAAITLLVNATSANAVLNKLRLLDLTSSSAEHRVMLAYIRKRIRARSLQMLNQLRQMRRARVDPSRLYRYCSVLREDEDMPEEEFVRRWRSGECLYAGHNIQPAAPAPKDIGTGGGAFNTDRGSGQWGSRFERARSVNLFPSSQGGAMNRSISAPLVRKVESDAYRLHREGVENDGGDDDGENESDGANRDAAAAASAEKEKEKENEKASDIGSGGPTSPFDKFRKREVSFGIDDSAFTMSPSTPSPLRDRTLSTDHSPIHGDMNIPPSLAEDPLNPDMLDATRRAFLEIVRMSYWNQVNSGKLPRKSTAARILLNSVDVALETTDTPGLQDWDEIEKHFDELYRNYYNTVGSGENDRRASDATDHGTSMGDSESQREGTISSAYNTVSKRLREYRDAQAVYLLTSFIDAHVYAQHRIAYFMGSSTEEPDTAEQALVIQESWELVENARSYLGSIDPETVTRQVSKLTARWVLHMQEDQIEDFLKEGVITGSDAEELLREAEQDLRSLGKVEWTDVVSRTFSALCRSSASRRQALLEQSRRQRDAMGGLVQRARQSLIPGKNHGPLGAEEEQSADHVHL